MGQFVINHPVGLTLPTTKDLGAYPLEMTGQLFVLINPVNVLTGLGQHAGFGVDACLTIVQR